MGVVNAITDEFIDFVKGVIASTELVPSDCVFDERNKSLVWLLESAARGIGELVVLIGLPNIQHDEKSAMAGGYKVSCVIRVKRNAVLCGAGSYAVAETLFRAFNGAKFYPGVDAAGLGDLNANVYADSLRQATRNETDSLHEIAITYYTEF